MQEALQGYENTAVMGTGPQERYAGDNRLFVEFYRKAVFNKSKSDEAGRPVYDEEDFVKITVPGDKYTNSDQKVNDSHKQRFPRQWQAYQAGMEQAQSGTPLEVWPQMTVGMVATLKAMKISTVEQLAELSDANAMQLMGNHDLRRRAKAFLEAAAGEAANSHLAAELEKRDKEIAMMREQVNRLLGEKQDSVSNNKPAKAAAKE